MTTPSNVFIFGDSITSTFQSPTYGSGAYANTIVIGYPWSQKICNRLGIPYTYRLSQVSPPWGPGYAVAGAGWQVNGTPGAGTSLPGQISQFLADYPSGVPAGALIIIWSSTNDILNCGVGSGGEHTYLNQGASIAQTNINSLISAGATRIILFDSYPAEYLQIATASGGIGSATYLQYQEAGNYWNTLMQNIGATTPQVQMFPVRQIYINRVNAAPNYPTPAPSITDYFTNNPTANPDNYLTYDGKHPTDRLHQYIAEAIWEPYILNQSPAPVAVPTGEALMLLNLSVKQGTQIPPGQSGQPPMSNRPTLPKLRSYVDHRPHSAADNKKKYGRTFDTYVDHWPVDQTDIFFKPNRAYINSYIDHFMISGDQRTM